MIHPSYVELMKVVNEGVEIGEEPVVNSRYSLVIAAAKRARQIIAGDEPMADKVTCPKPLSIAVEELYEGKVKIIPESQSRGRVIIFSDSFRWEKDDMLIILFGVKIQ